MRYTLPDGYIDLKESGNTYCGNIAHTLMHKASKVQRESKNAMSKMFHKKVDIDFNTCLLYMLKASYELDFNRKKGQ